MGRGLRGGGGGGGGAGGGLGRCSVPFNMQLTRKKGYPYCNMVSGGLPGHLSWSI